MLYSRLSKRVFSMSVLRTNFGKRLRQIRRQKDLTQEQLAEAVGVSPTFLSNLERGINGPSFDILQKLAEVLGVRVQEFFDFPEGQ
jgi:transcriptional regulator with XRE-family HTH domain